MVVRQAVFLVGGKGTRLGELAHATPKPLLEIAPGLKFLDVVIEEAARRGFDDILLLAGHLAAEVEATYQGAEIRGARITVLRELSPQGTAGALRFAADRLAEWFVMGNGDSFFDINLRALATQPPKDIIARLALREVDDPARYGAVTLDRAGRVGEFREKAADLKGPALINGGVYLMSRDILRWIAGPCSLERDVFPALARMGRLEGHKFDGFFLDIGLPETYAGAKAELPARRRRPCAFLDRDGVLNVDFGHTHRQDDLAWIDGAREAVRLLNDRGYFVIVPTNQAGVARGLYTEADVAHFHRRMSDELAACGAYIDAFYTCPFHPDAAIERYRVADHHDRKPNPGMILRALEEWPIDRARSFMIGDKESDMAAARAAGVRGALFVGGDLRDFVAGVLAGAG